MAFEQAIVYSATSHNCAGDPIFPGGAGAQSLEPGHFAHSCDLLPEVRRLINDTWNKILINLLDE